ncbi:redoxin domain-containing protein [Motilimonas sp. 1_MG-2023]|uniref:peroxiredoxin family protein n=1 Tax=Motilimonas sp. 1_MG-2023 TaxID=3062672 RepID=UPI0026E16CCA|nr:redoxin domain-containing protein [Motilimonas sp. 1_MG-2023]MDO6525946.1 redoxin domain-containing protein [Motilimonas sp. 1_MG-2023]
MKSMLTLLLTVASTVALARPDVGDKSHNFSATSLTGQSISLQQYKGEAVNLVFLDSLCPMPHFPGCEEKIAKLNKQVAAKPQANWVGFISSFYVDQGITEAFRDKYHIKIPLVFDLDNKEFQQYQVFATPYLIRLDNEHKIVERGDAF